ncbi:GatB/YqeY domain-containing protein, partial [bacterium]|nr:GatB/YqeY domain-containing protein [bacterium]
MAGFVEQISNDLKKAMKQKDELRLSVLRMLKTAIKNKQVELKTQENLKDNIVIQVIKSEAKKRQDSIVSYIDGGRQELADKEKQEFEILSEYLPEQMSEEEVRKVVFDVTGKLGDIGPADFGKVM